MERPAGARDDVFKSIHPLEGASGLSANDLANHINTAFLAPMVPLAHNPFCVDNNAPWRGSTDKEVTLLSELSMFQKLYTINPRHKGRTVSRDGS